MSECPTKEELQGLFPPGELHYIEKIFEYIKGLRQEIAELKSKRKCSCGKPIYFEVYCESCNKAWES